MLRSSHPAGFDSIVGHSLSFLCNFEVVEQEVEFVAPFADVPVATVPALVVEAALNVVQPLFGGVIYTVLIDHGQEGLTGDVLVWTSMRQHRVDYKTTLFHLMPAGFLDLIGRLFVRPPIEASHQPIILVHTVGTTQHKVRPATQREDLTVPGEEQLGIGLFIWILPTKDFLWAPLS